MVAIRRIPDVIVQEFLLGASVSGVAPSGTSLSFAFDNQIGGPFTPGEALSWAGGTGVLAGYVDNGLTGSMVIYLDVGAAAPTDGVTITGTGSGATADVDGAVTNNGVPDSAESIRRGRYRRFSGLVDGGLVELDSSIGWNGFSVRNVLITLPGITAVKLYVMDRNSNNVSAGIPTITSGDAYQEFFNNGLIVPPGCKFKVVGTGTLSAEGRIMFILSQGWGESSFDEDSPQLGRSNRP